MPFLIVPRSLIVLLSIYRGPQMIWFDKTYLWIYVGGINVWLRVDISILRILAAGIGIVIRRIILIVVIYTSPLGIMLVGILDCLTIVVALISQSLLNNCLLIMVVSWDLFGGDNPVILSIQIIKSSLLISWCAIWAWRVIIIPILTLVSLALIVMTISILVLILIIEIRVFLPFSRFIWVVNMFIFYRYSTLLNNTIFITQEQMIRNVISFPVDLSSNHTSCLAKV